VGSRWVTPLEVLRRVPSGKPRGAGRLGRSDHELGAAEGRRAGRA
jgi:hypothetical protein